MLPAVENKRYTSVIVGGGVRYNNACSASLFSIHLLSRKNFSRTRDSGTAGEFVYLSTMISEFVNI